MSEQQHTDGLSRRGLIGGAAALGAGAAVALGASGADALSPPATADQPTLGATALDPTNPALSHLPIDALAFFTFSTAGNDTRRYQDLTGIEPVTPATRIAASLALPAGSVIHHFNIAYQGSPILAVTKRDLLTPNPPVDVYLQTTTATGAPPRTQTLTPPAPITIEQGATYSLQFFCSVADSVFGVTVAYTPPTQGFQAFVGDPRVLDTRNGGGKLAPSEERVVALGFPGVRGAVLNLTVADTEGGGFVAVFRAGMAWPGNSSINWDSTGQLLSNGVITAVDAAGQIVIHGGANRTHVIIDRIGWLL